MWASAAMNCQSTVTHAALRRAAQAATSFSRVALSGMAGRDIASLAPPIRTPRCSANSRARACSAIPVWRRCAHRAGHKPAQPRRHGLPADQQGDSAHSFLTCQAITGSRPFQEGLCRFVRVIVSCCVIWPSVWPRSRPCPSRSKKALALVRDHIAVRGNLDPSADFRFGQADALRAKMIALRHQVVGSRWILSSGCDIPPGTPAENLAAFSEATAG